MQVADRWHLLHNLSEALIGALVPHHRLLAEVAQATASKAEAPAIPPVLASAVAKPVSRYHKKRQHNRERRLESYQAAVEQTSKGVTQREVAARCGLGISTPESALKTDRICADWQTVQRGTLQHEVFVGDAAVAYVDGSSVMIKVNCRADAGRLDDQIPYAIAVTLETPDDLRVPVYQEVAERIDLQAEVRAL